MANTSYGLRSLVQTFAPPLASAPGSSPFIPARVIDIILDDKHENFKNQGEWDSIGTIQFRSIYVPSNERNKQNFSFAKPFFSNIKHYPLKNEVVFVLFLPNQNTENTYDGSYYYIDTVNIWSSIHHNALPDVDNPKNYSEEQKRDYISTSAGASRRVTDSSTEIKLGDTFKEKADIHSLLPYEGDTIIEGRWGQSIRFGSTVNNGNIKNLWSDSGENGSPITIIRNGQSDKVPKEGWIPILEDVNNDKSSIYMGSTQMIPITVASTNQKSFSTIINFATPENIILPDIPPTPAPSQSLDDTDTQVSSSVSPVSSSATPTPIPSGALSPSEVDEIEFLLPGDVVDLIQQQEISVNLQDLNNEIVNEGKEAPENGNPIIGEVPFEVQQGGVWCFIASSTMLLKYAGVNITQQYIYNNFTNPSEALYWGKLFKTYGFTYSSNNIPGGQAGYDVLVKHMKTSNTPFILIRCRSNTTVGGGNGKTDFESLNDKDKNRLSHYVVVIGVTADNKLILNDPANIRGKKSILEVNQLKSKYGAYITVSVPPYPSK